jgi:hypothetical protein
VHQKGGILQVFFCGGMAEERQVRDERIMRPFL